MKIVHYYQADSDQLLRVVPVLIVTTLILIAICYKTGERPHWQWGGQRAD
jgi:ABC-type anion transport system duplicated permease subunit